MASKSHSAEAPQVPEEMIAVHQAGWKAFTHYTLYLCISVAAILILMLLFLRVY